MFYCDICAKIKGWPISALARSLGPCEICGQSSICNDVPSSQLPDPKNQTIPIDQWGKDHWSTFAYIEHCCTNNDGIPDLRRMRADRDLHPGLAVNPDFGENKKYPTRLKENREVHNHDDWSCVEDMEALGLLRWVGSGISPCFKLTDLGWKIAHQLREHKARKGNFADFIPNLK